MRAMLEVSTDYGYDISIYEEDLDGITASELWKLRMSRPVLKRCFAEGVMLMQGKTENDRVRPLRLPDFRRQTMGGPFGAVSGTE